MYQCTIEIYVDLKTCLKECQNILVCRSPKSVNHSHPLGWIASVRCNIWSRAYLFMRISNLNGLIDLQIEGVIIH